MFSSEGRSGEVYPSSLTPSRSGRVTKIAVICFLYTDADCRPIPKPTSRYLSRARNTTAKGETMATNGFPLDPTEDDALALFKAVEEKFPSKSLGTDKWYVLTVWTTCYFPAVVEAYKQ